MSDQFAPRPTSVTILAWLLIVGGLFGIVSSVAMFAINFESVHLTNVFPNINPVHKVVMAVSQVISVVCGIGFLKGINKARLLYIANIIFGTLVALIFLKTLPASSFLPGVMTAAIVLFILYRKPSDNFFRQAKAATDEASLSAEGEK